MVSASEAAAASGPLSDEAVVARVLAGEVDLFEVIMRRHNPRVYRTIRAILRDEAEVEDAMQQTYLLAYSGLRGFAGASLFSTWLTRIAVNEALGRRRRGGRLEVVAEVPEGAASAVEEDRAAAREAIRLVEEAVDRLPEDYRSVFMLREVQRLSTAEAAGALGLTEDAVKVRLHRARSLLRESIADGATEAAPDAFPFLAPRCDRVVAAVMAAIRRGAR